MSIEELYNNHTVYHHYHHSHSSQVSTSSLRVDIVAATASFHMTRMNVMMPHWHDANNQNYCHGGCTNTAVISSDMSGFGNIY